MIREIVTSDFPSGKYKNGSVEGLGESKNF
jgi:hypothetical protein